VGSQGALRRHTLAVQPLHPLIVPGAAFEHVGQGLALVHLRPPDVRSIRPDDELRTGVPSVTRTCRSYLQNTGTS